MSWDLGKPIWQRCWLASLKGLKGRRSVTRAPGQQHCRFPIVDCRLVGRICPYAKRIGNWQSTIGNGLAVAEGFEPSHGRINSAVPYQLGYATREFRISDCELRI